MLVTHTKDVTSQVTKTNHEEQRMEQSAARSFQHFLWRTPKHTHTRPPVAEWTQLQQRPPQHVVPSRGILCTLENGLKFAGSGPANAMGAVGCGP